jgi:hypothetical protein
MSRVLALKRDGTLKVSETQVCEQITDYLRLHGWTCIRTPATRVRARKGYFWIFEAGHPDYICVRPVESGRTDFFYAELKAPDAKTNKDRAVKQAMFAEEKTHQGFLCYRAPDGKTDKLEHFKAWYQTQFITTIDPPLFAGAPA